MREKYLEASNETRNEESILQEQFKSLWKVYPKKVGKRNAEIFAMKNIKKYGYEQMIRCVERYVAEKINTDRQFILQGSNFFHSRFIDYLDDNYAEKQKKEVYSIVKPEVIQATKVIAEIKGYAEYLEAMRTMPYKDYLKTEHWTHFKEEVFKFYGRKCMVCNSEDIIPNIHHRTYENRGRETFNDVIVICEKCHALFHEKTFHK